MEHDAGPNDEDPRLRGLARLLRIIDRLRSEGGCPWDRSQTLDTMAGHLLEESHELCEALDRGDDREIRVEAGDVLMNVFLIARIAEDEGRFSMAGICEAISDKLVRRHPHVFGEERAGDAAEALRNWEAIKREEREERGEGPPPSVLDGVPSALPALLRASRVGEKAAQTGFDWPDLRGPLEKCREELSELEEEIGREVRDRSRLEHEFGDLLFALVNLARRLGLDPEACLRKNLDRFGRRFRYLETKLGPRLGRADLAEMDALWEEAKALEE